MAKLLIVDDQEANRYMLDVLLKGHGHQVSLASNGAEALELARLDAPDIIITDILMPVMDGFTLCRNWKKDPELGRIPLVFYTATYTDPKDEQFALNLGAARFVIKPTAPDQFVQILDEVLLEYQGGKTAPIPDSFDQEEVYLKEYNQALVKKLEDKILQLEESNRKLTQETEERKKVQTELARSKEKYRSLIETVADPVIVYDQDGKVVYVNQSFSKVFGWTSQEVLGRQLDFVPSDESPLTMAKLDEVMRAGVCHGFETRRFTKDGRIVHVCISAASHHDAEGRFRGIVVSLQDITQRKQAEEEASKLEAQLRQAQKMEAIGTLAGGIAHDFNNILAAIIGFTEASLLSIPDDSPLRGNLGKVLEAGMRAKDLVKQILAFSRQTKQEIKPIKIGQIVEEVVNLLRATIHPNIEIGSKIEADRVVMGDSSQLHQVVMNICTNSVQAMQDDGGLLEITLDTIEIDPKSAELVSELTSGTYQRITISDTGHGMTNDVLDRIFEPFFTTKEQGSGTGLGLSVAHGIIKKHGGKTTAYSELGKGSTFSIYLPVMETGIDAESKAKAPLETPKGNESILFVDDEELLVDVGSQVLASLGYQVTCYTSALKALGAFKRDPQGFDVVLTDMNMPKLSGLDLANELIKIRPDIPIVLCTGFSERISASQSESLGIRKIIMKPMVARDIALAVREVLEAN
jgi:PAS domain S-box-containing protein